MAEQSPEPSRLARRDSADDIVLPFGTVRSRMAGRVVRLGPCVDRVLAAHDYPDAVSETLGEALALTALLGHPLKPGGRLILQTKTEGPLGFLVAHYDAPGGVRGYASFDRGKIDVLAAAGPIAPVDLIGRGRMAMTIDPGGSLASHQGIVALDGGSLTDAAHAYFRQSEQLPTFIRLAVARLRVAGASGAQAWRWRAGGLVVQHVPRLGGDPKPDETPEERDTRLHGEDDDDWRRVSLLASTVEAHELIDPTLSPERLLLRLFHEEGVRVGAETAVAARCRCSRHRIESFLKSFTAEELADMREADGAVTVTCEFCSTKYRFEPGEVGAEAGRG
ncbi:MAG: Hsp33 family molecular chaperone [Hyphomicrobiaceae bacterium]|nr:Hsp33 family molecular chaperone [Hyphomicrobiaceae bacterium]